MGPPHLWQFTPPFHPLKAARLVLQIFQPSPTKGRNRCMFCSVQFTASGTHGKPTLVYGSEQGHRVCQACFCEYKDHFGWPGE